MKPRFFDDLLRNPKADPVFITVDRPCLRYVRRSGICLLCDKSPTFYDLSCCYQREMWVLYSHQDFFPAAMELAHAIQSSGAKKTLVLLITV